MKMMNYGGMHLVCYQVATLEEQLLSRSGVLTVNMKSIFVSVLKDCGKLLLIHERGLTSLNSLKHMEERVGCRKSSGEN